MQSERIREEQLRKYFRVNQQEEEEEEEGEDLD